MLKTFAVRLIVSVIDGKVESVGAVYLDIQKAGAASECEIGLLLWVGLINCHT